MTIAISAVACVAIICTAVMIGVMSSRDYSDTIAETQTSPVQTTISDNPKTDHAEASIIETTAIESTAASEDTENKPDSEAEQYNEKEAVENMKEILEKFDITYPSHPSMT